MRNSPFIAALTLACTLLGGTPAHAIDTKLPEMGSSAATIASPEEQRQYGFYVLHELRNQGMVLDDALLTDYINALGYRLVSYSPKPDQPFTFFVVNDPSINAFALPGGFVGVNAGLITTTANEDELAAVLAHEISHVTQQHLVRAVEAEQKYAPLMVLAMVGAIVASTHTSPGSTSNADVGAMATATGLMQQMQINFTRADEEEADRVGIQTLAKANFDPDAMAGFFQRMQQALRPGFDENDVPALLMDHPVTLKRISEAKARALVVKKEEAQRRAALASARAVGAQVSPMLRFPGSHISSSAMAAELARPSESAAQQHARSEAYYELMRERVRVLASTQPMRTAIYYSDNLHNTPGFGTLPNRYGQVLALVRAGDAKKAVPLALTLAGEHPDNLVLQLALGSAEAMSGARAAALKRYTALEGDYPDNRALVLAHAQALLQVNDLASAKLAQKLLRPQLASDDEDPELQTVFARACEIAGDRVRAGEAHADAAYLNGRAEDALNQLKDLTKRSDLTYYQRARIEARIAQITPVVLELRRRKIRPEDQGKLAFGAAE
ncbi:MAG: M48 family metallopeptidase [Xanthomonadaceae bacterium]|nr:M48 family metalloprotease [Xanthomonadaceae bacterium]MDE1884945.1 M48 family metallopeptidase [Xanthomonadaceae bacterium]MDE1960576.1 M48 family metallopeptidase [Xanthomonadaceae bacterium]MDE2084008.1 M48 family metallopeptidase [Xanthomonadaceae bacterium]MDE2257589.1 M48 family metallopeptidase [Xanthomonadaceae bacterium]